jgi:O-antigen/teichoic acid export membrane protein
VRLDLVKNFLSLAGAELISKLVTFLAFAYLARRFGPAGYGYVEWAGAVMMCASLIVDQGFNLYGAREIAKDPSKTPSLVSEVVTVRFVLAALGYAAVVLFALAFVRERAVMNLVLVYGLSLWLLPLLLQWVFQGHDRMYLVSVTQLVRQTVFASVIFLFVAGPGDLLRVGFAEIAGVAAAVGLSVYLYRTRLSQRLELRPAWSTKLVREGVPIGLSQLLWVVKMFGATLLVGLIASAEDTGYFSAAMRIFIAVHTFVWLYFFNLLPSLSRAWERSEGEFAGLIANSLRIVAVLGVPAVAGGLLLSPYLMTAAYGSEFANGAAALRWMVGACMAAAISGHFRFGLIAASFQKREMYVTAAGAVCAAILVPVGYAGFGIGGSAAALFTAELVTLACAYASAKQLLFKPKAGRVAAVKEFADGITEAAR